MAGWWDLAGCTSCRGSASYPGKDLAGIPAFGLLSSDCRFERFLDILVLAFSCLLAALAAGVATTVRAQV